MTQANTIIINFIFNNIVYNLHKVAERYLCNIPIKA